VEDGVVDDDELRVRDWWPRGVRRAVADRVATPSGADFDLRRDVEAYGLTSNSGGYLRRMG